MVQYLAQGACQAIEDAYTVATEAAKTGAAAWTGIGRRTTTSTSTGSTEADSGRCGGAHGQGEQALAVPPATLAPSRSTAARIAGTGRWPAGTGTSVAVEGELRAPGERAAERNLVRHDVQ